MTRNTIVRAITRISCASVLVTAVLLPGAASAADGANDQATARSSVQDGTFVPVQRLEFTNDEIEGGVLGPEGELLHAVPRTPHRSLIELREHFLPEMVKSLEDV